MTAKERRQYRKLEIRIEELERHLKIAKSPVHPVRKLFCLSTTLEPHCGRLTRPWQTPCRSLSSASATARRLRAGDFGPSS